MLAGAQTPATTPATTAPSAEDLVRTGLAAQKKGDLRTAIESFHKALLLKPQMLEARVDFGAALAAAGNYDAAILNDKIALAAAPAEFSIRLNLATAYYRKMDIANARAEFEKLHAARPQDVDVAVLLGYCYVDLQRMDEAVKLLEPLEKGNESNLDLEYVLGYGMIQSGRAEEGLPRVERFAKERKAANAWTIVGAARFGVRQFHEAINALNEALAIDPKMPGVHTLLGQSLYAVGDETQAVTAFQAALREAPQDFSANLYLGILRLKQHDTENAKPLLELAIELQPTYPLARFSMAKLQSLTGEYPAAIKTLESLAISDPEWVEPHVELAALYFKVHREADGRKEQELVKKLEAKQQSQEQGNK